MKKLLLAVLAGSLLSYGAANAENYFSVSGGTTGKSDYNYAASFINSYNVNLDSGSNFSLAVGSNDIAMFGKNNFRGEMALSFRNQGNGKVDADGFPLIVKPSSKAYSLDFNFYYDVPTKSKLNPYLGAGFGISQISIDDGLLNDDTSTLHLLAMAGLGYKVTDKVTTFVEARAERYGTLTIENSLGKQDFSVSGVGIMAGLRIGF